MSWLHSKSLSEHGIEPMHSDSRTPPVNHQFYTFLQVHFAWAQSLQNRLYYFHAFSEKSCGHQCKRKLASSGSFCRYRREAGGKMDGRGYLNENIGSEMK